MNCRANVSSTLDIKINTIFLKTDLTNFFGVKNIDQTRLKILIVVCPRVPDFEGLVEKRLK